MFISKISFHIYIYEIYVKYKKNTDKFKFR